MLGQFLELKHWLMKLQSQKGKISLFVIYNFDLTVEGFIDYGRFKWETLVYYKSNSFGY